jgi:DNA-binding NarL/FixJ family response regulator
LGSGVADVDADLVIAMNPTGTVRILIADDFPAVREAIRRLLGTEPGWEVIAEAADGREAVQLAIDHEPDLAILDAAMPALSGIDATKEIVRAVPATRILLLTIYDDEPYVIEALEAGAHGYVLKEAADCELVRAAAEVLSGGRFVSRVIAFDMPPRYVPANN